MLTVERRYRYVWKPAIFVAGLVPLLVMLSGATGIGAAWLANIGIDAVNLGADPVREIIHRCGKTAINFLLLTLAVTPLRTLTGWTHLLRIRRMLGLFAFAYALLHFTAYYGLDQSFDTRALLADIAKRPWITVGMAALLILTPLAVTSTNRMMRRLGRRWQSLHRWIYAAAALGVWHFWWQVKRDVREPLLYVAILAVLLGWRAWRSRTVQRWITSRSAPATAPERT